MAGIADREDGDVTSQFSWNVSEKGQQHEEGPTAGARAGGSDSLVAGVGGDDDGGSGGGGDGGGLSLDQVSLAIDDDDYMNQLAWMVADDKYWPKLGFTEPAEVVATRTSTSPAWSAATSGSRRARATSSGRPWPRAASR